MASTSWLSTEQTWVSNPKAIRVKAREGVQGPRWLQPQKVKTMTEKSDIQIIELPSGRKAEIQQFKGKHIREAARLADSDSSKLVFALIAMLTTIDGEAIVMEDLDEMNGKDVMKLMGEFSEANF